MPIRRADDSSYTLASNLSATGSAVAIKGGEYQFSAEGTVGGSTISLQFQTPNGTWSDLLIFAGSPVKSTTLPFTQTQIDLPAGNVRMAATGGTPSALYAYLVGLG
jgi:hypothetical protein